MFSEIMRYILDLGPTVMLPIVIIIFSKLLGMKLGDCFKSGLHIGIGFVDRKSTRLNSSHRI